MQRPVCSVYARVSSVTHEISLSLATLFGCCLFHWFVITAGGWAPPSGWYNNPRTSFRVFLYPLWIKFFVYSSCRNDRPIESTRGWLFDFGIAIWCVRSPINQNTETALCSSLLWPDGDTCGRLA
ncbi:hypothetical protein FN846DRAFT_438098 [Sphaerosporella brunnea]|uniref:Uncharacterized protein n=1 Tax=Sphaerosporella brunnea TaxID=1250544 RepID=A0A5J5F4J6_9PEZI|nr:hypothetical protein FN846DRAFT_438098 [Sphaerosporella brunnea]